MGVLVAARAAALVAVASAAVSAQPTPASSRPKPAAAPAAIVTRSTPHLSFTAALSPTSVTAGSRVTIALDVVPKRGMHVYAPGTAYRPIRIALEPNTLLRSHEPVYPQPTRYTFEPLNEEVLVYSSRFSVRLDVTVGESGDEKPKAPERKVRVAATVEYQACDDRVCYLPASVPIEWTLTVKQSTADPASRIPNP